MKVVLGRVVGAHGVRGAIRVRIFGDGPDNLLQVRRVELADAALGAADPAARPFEIVQGGNSRAGEVKLDLEGIEDRDGAEALRGRIVLVEADVLEPLPEGEFYWYQLVGCHVEASDGSNVGRVRELWETGAHDVLVVETASGDTRLIPTAQAVLREVDLGARKIVLEDWPGLIVD